jgi:hypothetical protein
MSADVTTPGLPPVVVGSKRAGDGRLFLNVGIDAHNAALFAGEHPGDLAKVIPRRVLIVLSVAVVLGALAVVALFLPIDPFYLPAWVMEAWLAVFIIAIAASFIMTGIEFGGALRARKHSRAIKVWRTQLESALHGHREQLVSLDSLALRPQYPDVKALIEALDQARTSILNAGDRHGSDLGQPELLNALASLGRYAQDDNPSPGRRESAHHAVAAFERAAIDHIASQEAPL